jgi:hypothetical protein
MVFVLCLLCVVEAGYIVVARRAPEQTSTVAKQFPNTQSSPTVFGFSLKGTIPGSINQLSCRLVKKRSESSICLFSLNHTARFFKHSFLVRRWSVLHRDMMSHFKWQRRKSSWISLVDEAVGPGFDTVSYSFAFIGNFSSIETFVFSYVSLNSDYADFITQFNKRIGAVSLYALVCLIAISRRGFFQDWKCCGLLALASLTFFEVGWPRLCVSAFFFVVKFVLADSLRLFRSSCSWLFLTVHEVLDCIGMMRIANHSIYTVVMATPILYGDRRWTPETLLWSCFVIISAVASFVTHVVLPGLGSPDRIQSIVYRTTHWLVSVAMAFSHVMVQSDRTDGSNFQSLA